MAIANRAKNYLSKTVTDFDNIMRSIEARSIHVNYSKKDFIFANFYHYLDFLLLFGFY